jgi:acyl carrier protein
VPIGVPGEVCIGGASVARGYLNKSELTAEKFLPDPFSKDPGARMYRTGDLARFAEDGNIEFLGRIDNQVKIRGFRVELGEIETMLLAHESVREAVVVAREAAKGDRRLVAYVVSETAESNALRQELRTFLKRRMPEYMVPSDFVLLDAIPLTSNGKINHRALPEVDASAGEFGSSCEAPRSEVEEKMAELWCGVLKRGRVGIHDNFFELGGHSLLATQLVSRLRETFRVELPLRRLFESPTVAELSAIVVQLEGVRQEVPDIIRTTSNTEELLAKIDELSDEEVEALLSRELAEKSSE